MLCEAKRVFEWPCYFLCLFDLLLNQCLNTCKLKLLLTETQLFIATKGAYGIINALSDL